MGGLLTASRRNGCFCCPVFFLHLTTSELLSHSQIIRLLCVTSALTSRSFRLGFFFLGVLLQFAICAFLYDLREDTAYDQSSSVYSDSVFRDGVFSTLLSLPMLASIGLCFRLPPRLTTELSESLHSSSLVQDYAKALPRLRCRFYSGTVLFMLIGLFLCVYLIAFGDMATFKAQEEWLVSSAFAIAMDAIILDLASGLMVGFIGLLAHGCQLNCFFSLIAMFYWYRGVRNLAPP